jgi:A/G-specific adenine glycosylase
LGLQISERSPTYIAPVFRHTFTHFHLDIEPVYIEVAEPEQTLRERDDIRWYTTGSNEPLGLSAPAVKLITSLSEFSLT